MRILLGSRRSAGPRAEGGSAAVEFVLVTPVLMFAVFVVVQAALYMHARQVVLAAAQQGARLARAAAPSDQIAIEQARTGALRYVAQLGPDVVSEPAVAVIRADGSAAVTVSARAVSILPGVPLRVHQRATGPVERFRQP